MFRLCPPSLTSWRRMRITPWTPLPRMHLPCSRPVHANTTDVDEDATHLSTGDTAIFPCTIRYMDLRVLELTNFSTRIPQLMFLRKEWDNMVDIFNRREKGIRGSAVFTGQPGIGEVVLPIGLGKRLHGTSVALANQEISSHLLSV